MPGPITKCCSGCSVASTTRSTSQRRRISGQRYFPETGHNLGGIFRAYWEQYGGLFIYGLPLTEEFAEKSSIDGKTYIVQYFERARFEFHPENTGKSQVLLGLLGRQLLKDRGWIK